MMLDELAKSEKSAERLMEAVESGNVSHAYVFEGPASADKVRAAKAFTKALLCKAKPGRGCASCVTCRKIDADNHEDVLWIEKDDLSVKVRQILELQEAVQKKPYGERNIAIIKDADSMVPEAQNKLLKTLEEPPAGTVIILLSENRENLLQTVRSRSVILRFSNAATEANAELPAEVMAILKMINAGEPFYRLEPRVSNLLSSGSKKGEAKEKAAAFLDALEESCETLLLGRDPEAEKFSSEYLCRVVDAVEKARGKLSANVKPAYAVKDLIIEIGG